MVGIESSAACCSTGASGEAAGATVVAGAGGGLRLDERPTRVEGGRGVGLGAGLRLERSVGFLLLFFISKPVSGPLNYPSSRHNGNDG
jgi:hypothetical protein